MLQNIPTKREVAGWVSQILKVELEKFFKEQYRLEEKIRMMEDQFKIIEHQLEMALANYKNLGEVK